MTMKISKVESENTCGGFLGVTNVNEVDAARNFCGNVDGKFDSGDSSCEIDKGFLKGEKIAECPELGTGCIVLGSAVAEDGHEEELNTEQVLMRACEVEKVNGDEIMMVEITDLDSGNLINSDCSLIPTESSQAMVFESDFTTQDSKSQVMITPLPVEDLGFTDDVMVVDSLDSTGKLIDSEGCEVLVEGCEVLVEGSEFCSYPSENQKAVGIVIVAMTSKEKLDLTGLEESQVSVMQCEPQFSDIVGENVESKEQVIDNPESVIEDTEIVEFDLNLNRDNAEIIDDNKESQIVVMDNADDDAAQSANIVEHPLKTDTFNDKMTNEITTPRFEEVIIDNTQTDTQWPATESLKSEDKNGKEFLEEDLASALSPNDVTLVGQQVEHVVPEVTENESSVCTDYKTEIQTPDDKQTEFEVEEVLVKEDTILIFPDTFVCSNIKIEFGSFGRHEKDPNTHPHDLNVVLEVEPKRGTKNNDPEINLEDLEENKSDEEEINLEDLQENRRDDKLTREVEINLEDLQENKSDDKMTHEGDINLEDLQENKSDNKVIHEEEINNEDLQENIIDGKVTHEEEINLEDLQESISDEEVIHEEVKDMDSVVHMSSSVGSSEVNDAETEEAEVLQSIRVPRFEDEKFNEQIKEAQLQLDEKTKYRDVIGAEIQAKKATQKAHDEAFKAARQLVRSKRHEIDSIKFVINKIKNANTVEDIDSSIQKLCLKDEKKFIHEINQLKSLSDQLASNVGSDEIEQALIQERLTNLSKELKSLKDDVSKAEEAALTIRKRCEMEKEMGKELQAQFQVADEVRQEAYGHLNSLKTRLHNKNKPISVVSTTIEEQEKTVSSVEKKQPDDQTMEKINHMKEQIECKLKEERLLEEMSETRKKQNTEKDEMRAQEETEQKEKESNPAEFVQARRKRSRKRTGGSSSSVNDENIVKEKEKTDQKPQECPQPPPEVAAQGIRPPLGIQDKKQGHQWLKMMAIIAGVILILFSLSNTEIKSIQHVQ